MFLSRKLNSAEKNYWLMKLEIVCLIWMLKKIWHIIKTVKNETIIYTDYSAILKIVKQTSFSTLFTDKLNLYLIQIFQYIQLFNLQIFHKSDKTHLVSDILSWFFSKAFSDNIELLNALHVDILHENVKYTAIMIELSEEFRRCLQDEYQKDLKLWKVLEIIANNDKLSLKNRAKLLYKSEKNLLY